MTEWQDMTALERVERIREVRPEVERIVGHRGGGSREQGAWAHAAKISGIPYRSLRRALDRDYDQRCREQNSRCADRIRGTVNRRKLGLFISKAKAVARDAEANRLKALIPDDTRHVTGRMFGDPLPGRSALDRKREMEAGR